MNNCLILLGSNENCEKCNIIVYVMTVFYEK